MGEQREVLSLPMNMTVCVCGWVCVGGGGEVALNKRWGSLVVLSRGTDDWMGWVSIPFMYTCLRVLCCNIKHS